MSNPASAGPSASRDGGPTAWQVPQEFEAATGYQIRDELGDLVARDLLGPWDGPTEALAVGSMGPRERYLAGMLGPRPEPGGAAAGQMLMPDVDLGVDGAGEADLPETVSPQHAGRMWASSMGLSFTVDAATAAVSVLVEWGRYRPEEVPSEEGRPKRRWVREPVARPLTVALDGAGEFSVPLADGVTGGEIDDGTGGVWLRVRVRSRDGRRVVRLTLVNCQPEEKPNGDVTWLFQPAITVTAPGGQAAVFCAADDPLDPGVGARGAAGGGDPEERHLRLLYRDRLRHATGHNVAVHAEVRAGQRRAWRLATTWLPVYEVPQVSAAGAASGVPLGMDELARLAADDDPAGLAAALGGLVDGYDRWLTAQDARVAGLPDGLRDAAAGAVHRARQVAQRIRDGVELLSGHTPQAGQARRALAFANQAMAAQRRATAIGGLRGDDPTLSYQDAAAAVAKPRAAMWRPFQLAFVLLNLPALTDPGHAQRTGSVDLLFFPTGGGKTEAYLGLAAYTFAIRRLQGVVGSGVDARDGGDGVAVLMRYTLRLLTAQQFQRAAALVCAAELLRREDPQTWGGVPFRIGLWVGGSVSPNWYRDAADQIAEARETGRGGAKVNVLQTLVCPWCGEPLQAHRDLHPDDDRRRVRLYCGRGEGPEACPFSRTATVPGVDGEANQEQRGLPILTVDEEIYRYPPSLLIATVDKLAQLPWYGFAGMLFGRVSQRCPRHGYRHPDLDGKVDCGGRHNPKPGLAKVVSVPVTRLRPPDLIIQDELHLISGALGTTVGLFESAVEELCAWMTPEGVRTGPKIIASTATTKRAAEQVRRLYARDLSIFPPQVLDASDTFFSTEQPVGPAAPGRRYLGVCAHGVRMKHAEIRLAEILLLAGQSLFDRYGAPADPYLTLVGYFNATRELAGMRRYLDDDVTTRVRRNGGRRGLSNRTPIGGMLSIRELTSRINSGDIAAVLKELEERFDDQRHTSARRAAMVAEARAAQAGKRDADLPKGWGHTPVDVVLATSMLQVGVDVSRFALMVVTGQPKNTAEYIQASSRVGRAPEDGPGLVVTVYNWTRPRDLAHFEDFAHYHATFYRQVEALSVTPYSRRSLDRGTAATFVAAVRNVTERYSVNANAFEVDLAGATVTALRQRMLARAARAGGRRNSDYLAERINTLCDRWAERKRGSARLGYADAKSGGTRIVGLLEPAGNGGWTDLTVGRSMRETENEINLLLPGSGLFDTVYDAPDWSFGTPAAGTDEDNAPSGVGDGGGGGDGGGDDGGGDDGGDGGDGDELGALPAERRRNR
ncbi:MAG: DISARM system helicase DrmA [Micromonosporaceae bacterium]|nr:DISARM system helicase DrmA [Micromonosporaceae bacterium]